MTKRFIALFIAVLMLLSFAACGDSSTDETTAETPSTTSYIREIKTNIAAVDDVTGFGLSKLAKDRDYAYTVNYCDDVQQVKELIKSGKADVAAMSIADAVSLYNEGTDIRIVAVNNFASMFVVAKGFDISEPSHLKGKKIYALNTDLLTESFAKTLLADNGIKYEDLDIQIFGSISEIIAEIEGKSEYVLMIPGVEASKLPEDEGRRVALDFTSGWVKQKGSLPVHSVTVARADFIASNPELIDEFRMFNEVSVNFIISNVESGALHLYEADKMESLEGAMAYLTHYCTLGYAENDKMKTIATESLQAYGEGELPPDTIYYIN